MPQAPRSPAAARLAYAVVVFCATLVGLRLDPDPASAARRLARAFHPQLSARDVVDGLRNVLLFAGLGATWVSTARDGRWSRAIAAATAAGLALSALVESAQLFSPVRTASLLDLATNTGGALCGAVATAGVMRMFAARRGARSYVGVPAAALALPYLGAALLEAFAPLFRHTPAPGAWGGPARRWAAAMAAGDAAARGFPVLDALLFVPAGYLLVVALGEWGVDTHFTTVDRNRAVACADAIDPAFLDQLEALGIDLVLVSYDEVQRLGGNILSLGDDRVLSSADNHRLNGALERLGYRVLPVEIDQFVRCGGGIHCLTLPLARLPG